MTDVDEQILEELKGLRQDVKGLTDQLNTLNNRITTMDSKSEDYNKASLKLSCQSLGINGTATVVSGIAIWFASSSLILQLWEWMYDIILAGTIIVFILSYWVLRTIKKDTHNDLQEIEQKYHNQQTFCGK
ncbi:MAG TPA: hypothetical protein O0X46_04325 [Methanocorpusculum sp.]|nr:hypothetical protein [Methanocorpusculum sp.]HJK55266.1 hypothetical protein [Methanocorpusculum sp.]HJK57979.1 hypothetical protein [Methanocorpusculum sp.]HJK59812.1 hypothetical protein [Methanocorpusculum sp.]